MTTTRATAYKTCHDCPAQLRPVGTLVAEHPGTVAHRGKSMCTTCYKGDAAEDAMTAGDGDEAIERLRRHMIDFHRGLRRRKGLDDTAPIDLRQIALGVAA